MNKKRLDQILLEENLITEDQIKAALEIQKTEGGRFGAALLKHGFIEELDLVKALAKQHNCEGVVLTGLEIPEIVTKFIPSKVAHARLAIPFDYDLENNVVKIACEDPNNVSLQRELNFVATGKKVKLFMAAEYTLKLAIEKYYKPKPKKEIGELEIERVEIYQTENASTVVDPDEPAFDLEDIQYRSLDLLTNLLSSKSSYETNHCGLVAGYVDKLCRILKIDKDRRIKIVTASFLHDLAKYIYEMETTDDVRKPINMTIKFLESLSYPPEIIKIIDRMYRNLETAYSENIPSDILGGNILTVVDIYFENKSADSSLTLDQFEKLKESYHESIGKMFLQKVTEAFLSLITDEILPEKTLTESDQIMLYTTLGDTTQTIENRLKKDNFRVISVTDQKEFVELFNRSKPKFIIIAPDVEKEDVHRLLIDIQKEGLKFTDIPTYLVIEGRFIGEFIHFLEEGIEDIISLDNNIDLLYVKLRKFKTQVFEKQKHDSKTSATDNPESYQKVTSRFDINA